MYMDNTVLYMVIDIITVVEVQIEMANNDLALLSDWCKLTN